MNYICPICSQKMTIYMQNSDLEYSCQNDLESHNYAKDKNNNEIYIRVSNKLWHFSIKLLPRFNQTHIRKTPFGYFQSGVYSKPTLNGTTTNYIEWKIFNKLINFNLSDTDSIINKVNLYMLFQ